MNDPYLLSGDDDEDVIASDSALGQTSLLSHLNLHLSQQS